MESNPQKKFGDQTNRSIAPENDRLLDCFVRNKSDSTPSRREYERLADALDHFNRDLFDSRLPQVLITLNHRSVRVRGYYHHDHFCSRHKVSPAGLHISEISLNPKSMAGRSDEQILSTLVHEMAHLYQFTYGRPSRSGYHNRQWADLMEQVGLMPSDTGEAGGKRTGQHVTHYILAGGPFQSSCRRLLENGWRLDWHVPSNQLEEWSGPVPPPNANDSKTKFTCGVCAQNAWAKPSAQLICGRCQRPMRHIG